MRRIPGIRNSESQIHELEEVVVQNGHVAPTLDDAIRVVGAKQFTQYLNETEMARLSQANKELNALVSPMYRPSFPVQIPRAPFSMMKNFGAADGVSFFSFYTMIGTLIPGAIGLHKYLNRPHVADAAQEYLFTNLPQGFWVSREQLATMDVARQVGDSNGPNVWGYIFRDGADALCAYARYWVQSASYYEDSGHDHWYYDERITDHQCFDTPQHTTQNSELMPWLPLMLGAGAALTLFWVSTKRMGHEQCKVAVELDLLSRRLTEALPHMRVMSRHMPYWICWTAQWMEFDSKLEGARHAGLKSAIDAAYEQMRPRILHWLENETTHVFPEIVRRLLAMASRRNDVSLWCLSRIHGQPGQARQSDESLVMSRLHSVFESFEFECVLPANSDQAELYEAGRSVGHALEEQGSGILVAVACSERPGWEIWAAGFVNSAIADHHFSGRANCIKEMVVRREDEPLERLAKRSAALQEHKFRADDAMVPRFNGKSSDKTYFNRWNASVKALLEYANENNDESLRTIMTAALGRQNQIVDADHPWLMECAKTPERTPGLLMLLEKTVVVAEQRDHVLALQKQCIETLCDDSILDHDFDCAGVPPGIAAKTIMSFPEGQELTAERVVTLAQKYPSIIQALMRDDTATGVRTRAYVARALLPEGVDDATVTSFVDDVRLALRGEKPRAFTHMNEFYVLALHTLFANTTNYTSILTPLLEAWVHGEYVRDKTVEKYQEFQHLTEINSVFLKETAAALFHDVASHPWTKTSQFLLADLVSNMDFSESANAGMTMETIL